MRNRIEDYYNLSLSIAERKSVQECLDKMIEGEVINDFTCEKCNKKVDITKRTLISHTPNVLIIHLQRFAFNFDTFRNEKVNTLLEFPNTLDLKPYSFYDVMGREGKKAPEKKKRKEGMDEEEWKRIQEEEEEEAWPEEDDCFEYKLVGVTVHSGTAHAGHYYSFINTKRGGNEEDESSETWVNTQEEPWKEFNDSRVSEFEFSKLRNECFGGDSGKSEDWSFMSSGSNTYGKSGYMLVYERRVKKPVKVLVDEE